MLIAGARRSGSGRIEVRNPYSDEVVDTVSAASQADIAAALSSAAHGSVISRNLSRRKRAEFLDGAADLLARRQEEFARRIVEEAGKTIVQARKEVGRCIATLRLSAEEAMRLTGETIPFDAWKGSEDRRGYFVRDPLGMIVAITPFNDPLNLVAHKVGPALAGGNSLILKPSARTPLSALSLAELLLEAGMPPQLLSVLIGGSEVGAALVSAADVRMISFTGGHRTAEVIARTAGLKKLAMELGGNGPVIVLDDCDVAGAVKACVAGAFWAAGQNCIGVQRILVHRRIYEEFRSAFIARTKTLIVGDPMDDATDMGPMIEEGEARRVQGWVDEALERGAKVLTGHVRERTIYHPTVLENVPASATISCEEAFGPVAILEPIESLEQGIRQANASEFSIHAAIFTRSLDKALLAAEQLEAGGIMVNDSTDYRIDAMPFGGYKRGGMGREGVRFAIQEMTQPKVICFNMGGSQPAVSEE